MPGNDLRVRHTHILGGPHIILLPNPQRQGPNHPRRVIPAEADKHDDEHFPVTTGAGHHERDQEERGDGQQEVNNQQGEFFHPPAKQGRPGTDDR